MSATLELFDRWKALKKITSDRQASATLGLSAGAAAQWRMGRNGSAAVIERMAHDLGEDPIPVILQAFSEASRDAEDRRTLARMAKRLGAACLALFMLAPMVPSSAEAAEPGAWKEPGYTLCEIAWRRLIAGLTLPLWLTRAFGLLHTESPRCSHLASNPASR